MTTLALPAGAGTLNTLDPVEQVVLGYLAKLKSKSTLRAYQEDLRNYFQWCQQNGIGPLAVKRAHLDMYVRWMQSQNRWAEQTIARRIGTVCGLMKYAAMEDFLPKDPSLGVERPTVDRAKQHRTWLTPVDFAQLLKTSQETGPMEHALVCLLGMMGLRVGEVCSLNVENLREDRAATRSSASSARATRPLTSPSQSRHCGR